MQFVFIRIKEISRKQTWNHCWGCTCSLTNAAATSRI